MGVFGVCEKTRGGGGGGKGGGESGEHRTRVNGLDVIIIMILRRVCVTCHSSLVLRLSLIFILSRDKLFCCRF